MKRSRIATIYPALVFAASAFAQTSFAQTPTATSQPAPSPNIVTIDFNAAVLQTAEAQRDLGTLQTKYSPRQADLQKLNDQVESLRKQLSDNSTQLSESEKAAREQTLNLKEKQLQREVEDFRNDSQSESQQSFQRIAQKVYALVQEFSQQHAYTLVVERGNDSSPIVWYAANGIDITDQIVSAYNAKPVSALPDKPASAGATANPQRPRSPAAPQH